MKRLTPALVTMLMLGVVGFLVVAYVAKKFLFAGVEETPQVARRNIPTAIVAIEPGTIITEKHLGVAPIRVDNIDAQTLVSDRVILGRVAKNLIEPLSQIRTDDLYPPGDGPEIEVESGMQAVTVALRDSSDVVDGLIRPGQFVNVHFHPSVTDRRMRKGMVMTLFEGVKVLALNRSFRPTDDDRAGTTVTFELSEEQANILLLARDHGEITLAYTPEGRGTGGVSVSQADRAFLEDVLGLDPLPEPKKPFRTDHYKGAGRSSQYFIDGRAVSGAGRADYDQGDFGGFDSDDYLRAGGGASRSYDSGDKRNDERKPTTIGRKSNKPDAA